MPDKDLNKRIDNYVNEIDILFQKYTDMLIRIVIANKIILKDDPFDFYNYRFSEKVKKRFRNMYSQLYAVIKDSITAEWNNSNKKNDEWVKTIKALKDKERYFTKTEEALNAFFKRKKEGLTLSQRVWKITTRYKTEIELSVDAALREGKPARYLAGEIKKNLKEPDSLFRKIKTHNNKKTISKVAREYNPGQGVYRSSTKNAQRLARTEINMSYRLADIERWQTMDFVVGYEVKRSNNPYSCPVCESLSGKYPKYFIFPGWHPNCRCYLVPVLMTNKEIIKLNEYIIKGREIDWKSKNEIKSIPDNMIKWMNENNDRINNAKTLPYFIRNNKSIFKI